MWVETESQKGILIGAGGRMIKAIGTAARRELERELGRHVHLDLPVRVRRRGAATTRCSTASASSDACHTSGWTSVGFMIVRAELPPARCRTTALARARPPLGPRPSD